MNKIKTMYWLWLLPLALLLGFVYVSFWLYR